MCYFPKLGSKKAISKSEKPRADWELHAVRRMSHNDITEYTKALEKEKKACYTSTIDTDEGARQSTKTTRKRQRPSRYESSASDSDSAISSELLLV